MLIKFLFPNKEEFKERKIAFVDFVIDTCKRIPLSDKIIGEWIRAFHWTSPFGLLYIILHGPYYLATISLICSIFILLLFIYFRGCFLSKAEKILCKDEINISDILIELHGIKIDYTDKQLLSKQRYELSIYCLSCWSIIIFSIYYYRFIK